MFWPTEAWTYQPPTDPPTSELMVLASVIGSNDDLAAILRNVPNADPFVCRLSAPVQEPTLRLDRREIGAAHDWHVRRAAELVDLLAAGDVDDLVVETTGRTVRDIAVELLISAGWPFPAR